MLPKNPANLTPIEVLNTLKNQKFNNLETKSKKLATYLIKNGLVYYFCKRINGKILKFSLRTKNIQTAFYRRNLILKMNLKELEELSKNRYFKVVFNEDGFEIEKSNDKEDDEIILRASQNIAKEFLNKKNSTNTDKDIYKIAPLMDELFYHFKNEKIKMGKVKAGSLNAYEASYNLLFNNLENKKVYLYTTEEFENLRDKLKFNAKTINNHLTYFKMFFEYGIKKGYIEKNPLQYVEMLKEEKSNKENFTDTDIINLLETELIEQEYKDLIKFASYTGMRISEILLLDLNDIKEEDNIKYIDIPLGKTDNAARRVPFHNEILHLADLKFIDILRKNTNFIQKEGQRNAFVLGITKNVNRRINKIIPSAKKTFHSARGTVSEKLINHKSNINQIIYIKNLIGHSQGENSLTINTYAKKIDINILKSLIDTLKYKKPPKREFMIV